MNKKIVSAIVLLVVFCIIVIASHTSKNTEAKVVTNTSVKYVDAIHANVLPLLVSADQDIVNASNMGGVGNFSSALESAKNAQLTMVKVKSAFSTLQPAPVEFAALNELLSKSITSYSTASDQLVSGISNQDPTTVKSAETYINQGDEYVKQASTLIEQLNNK